MHPVVATAVSYVRVRQDLFFVASVAGWSAPLAVNLNHN